ncbi:MAG: hypothetical protein ACOCXT_06170 [Candidatus Dojkabacteria bacterium]
MVEFGKITEAIVEAAKDSPRSNTHADARLVSQNMVEFGKITEAIVEAAKDSPRSNTHADARLVSQNKHRNAFLRTVVKHPTYTEASNDVQKQIMEQFRPIKPSPIRQDDTLDPIKSRTVRYMVQNNISKDDALKRAERRRTKPPSPIHLGVEIELEYHSNVNLGVPEAITAIDKLQDLGLGVAVEGPIGREIQTGVSAGAQDLYSVMHDLETFGILTPNSLLHINASGIPEPTKQLSNLMYAHLVVQASSMFGIDQNATGAERMMSATGRKSTFQYDGLHSFSIPIKFKSGDIIEFRLPYVVGWVDSRNFAKSLSTLESILHAIRVESLKNSGSPIKENEHGVLAQWDRIKSVFATSMKEHDDTSEDLLTQLCSIHIEFERARKIGDIEKKVSSMKEKTPETIIERNKNIYEFLKLLMKDISHLSDIQYISMTKKQRENIVALLNLVNKEDFEDYNNPLFNEFDETHFTYYTLHLQRKIAGFNKAFAKMWGLSVQAGNNDEIRKKITHLLIELRKKSQDALKEESKENNDEPPEPPQPPAAPPGTAAGGGEVPVRDDEPVAAPADEYIHAHSTSLTQRAQRATRRQTQPASASPACAVNTHPVHGNAQAATAPAPERSRRSIRDSLDDTQIAFIKSLAGQERDTFLSHINGIIATQPGTTLPQAIQQVMDTYTAIDGFTDMVGASTRLRATQQNVAFQNLPAYLQNRVNDLSENKQLGRMFGKNLLPFLVQTAQYIADSCPNINSDGATHSIDDGSFMNWILIGLINSDNQYARQDAHRNIHDWTEKSLEQLKNGDGEAFVQLVQFLDNLSNSSVNASIFASDINKKITDYIHRNITIPEQKEKERQEMQAKAEQIIAYAVEVGAITGDIATYILGTSWSIGAPLVGWVLIKTAKLLGCTLEVAIGASTRAGGKAVESAVGYVSDKLAEPQARKLIDQANTVQKALEKEAINGKPTRRHKQRQKWRVSTRAESNAHRAQEELEIALNRGRIPLTHMEDALRAIATHSEAQQVIQAHHRTAHTVRSGKNASNPLGSALAQNRINMSEATFSPRTGKNSPGVEPVTQRINPYLSAITRNGNPEVIRVPDLTNQGVAKLVRERHDLAARRSFFQYLKSGMQWHFGTRDGTKEEKLKRIDKFLADLHEKSNEHNAGYDICHQTIDNVAHVLGLGEKNVSPAQVDKNVIMLIDKFTALDRIQHSIQQLEERINQTRDVLSKDHNSKYTRALQQLIAAEKKLLETGVHPDGDNKILTYIIQRAGKASEIGLLLAEKLQKAEIPSVTPVIEMTADAVTGTGQGEEDTGTEVSCGSNSTDVRKNQEVSTPITTDDGGIDIVRSDTPGTTLDNLILPEPHNTDGPTRPKTPPPHTGEDSTPGATAVSAKSQGPDPMMQPQVPAKPSARKKRWTNLGERVGPLTTKNTTYPGLIIAHQIARGAATTARRGGATALSIAASGAGAGAQLLGGGLHLAGSAAHKIDIDRKQIADAMRNASRREEHRLSQMNYPAASRRGIV